MNENEIKKTLTKSTYIYDKNMYEESRKTHSIKEYKPFIYNPSLYPEKISGLSISLDKNK